MDRRNPINKYINSISQCHIFGLVTGLGITDWKCVSPSIYLHGNGKLLDLHGLTIGCTTRGDVSPPILKEGG